MCYNSCSENCHLSLLLSPTQQDVLKLGDFGSCRSVYSKQPYTEYISTRWYRAPECLLTDGFYSYKMDLWSAGCVFFEMARWSGGLPRVCTPRSARQGLVPGPPLTMQVHSHSGAVPVGNWTGNALPVRNLSLLGARGEITTSLFLPAGTPGPGPRGLFINEVIDN